MPSQGQLTVHRDVSRKNPLKLNTVHTVYSKKLKSLSKESLCNYNPDYTLTLKKVDSTKLFLHHF